MTQPDERIHVALVEPEIPPNTGTIARMCAAMRAPLHIVGEIGFRMDDRRLRRAGLDYWPWVDLRCHDDVDAFVASLGPDPRPWLFTVRGERAYTDVVYRPGDVLVFGSETRGLPDALLDRFPDRRVRIPIREPNVRSINLATAAAAALGEALRQVGDA